MKVLLVNLCSDPLSELEFIEPIKNIIESSGFEALTKRYAKICSEDLKIAEKIIICGTALKDDDFLRHIDKFKWLKRINKPVLGIGSGLMPIAHVFGCKIINQLKIGAFEVNLIKGNKLTDKERFYSYFLTKAVIQASNLMEALARTENIDCMIKHKDKEIYGCLFHPEAANPEIISNFLLKI